MTGPPMTFIEHLEELRGRLVKSAIAVAVGSVAGFLVYPQVLDLLAAPYKEVTGQEGLVYFGPTEAFSLVMRVSLFSGIILASPVVLYQVWRFVAPALTPREKRWAVPITGVFVVLFVGGVLVGYWSLSRGLGFLLDFGGDALVPLIGGEKYLNFAMRFLLAFGAAFEFPIFLFAAAAVGVIDSKKLRAQRRWAVLVILVAAAIITPSGDPMTLMLMSTPLYVLYEATILAIRVFLRR